MSANTYEEIGRLGGFLLGLRQDANLTQQELADSVGVTRQTIASIENGHGDSVAFGTWVKIANKLLYHFDLEKSFYIPQPLSESEIQARKTKEESYGSWILGGE